MNVRKNFRCVIVEANSQAPALCTGIMVNVPSGLTRHQAVDYVTGAIAKEISRYAAWEALGMGPVDNNTDYNEIVT
jgi:hypothetical protein